MHSGAGGGLREKMETEKRYLEYSLEGKLGKRGEVFFFSLELFERNRGSRWKKDIVGAESEKKRRI